MLQFYEWGWLLTTLICLSIASYYDFKDRIIPDKIWLTQLGFGMVFNMWWFTTGPRIGEILEVVANIIIIIIVVIITLFSGAMGGGDVKAIFALGISFPRYISLTSLIPSLSIRIPVILYYLLNVFALFVLIFIGFYGYNLFIFLFTDHDLFGDTKGQPLEKFALLGEGIKIHRDTFVKWKHYNVAEKYVDGSWQIHTPRFEQILTDEEYEKLEQEEKREALENIDKTEKDYIWIRPQIPGVVIFLFAYLILILMGPLFAFVLKWIPSLR